MSNPPTLARGFRGEHVECAHYGHVAVVDQSAKIVHKVGDPFANVYLRSAAKPVQAVPLGSAAKINDGNNRAAPPAVLALLKSLGLISDDGMALMQDDMAPEIRNHCGILVGRVECVYEF